MLQNCNDSNSFSGKPFFESCCSKRTICFTELQNVTVLYPIYNLKRSKYYKNDHLYFSEIIKLQGKITSRYGINLLKQVTGNCGSSDMFYITF